MRDLTIQTQLKLLGIGLVLSFSALIAASSFSLQRTRQLSAEALQRGDERLSRAIRMEGYVHTNVARIRATAASADPSLETLLRKDIATTEAAFVADLKAVEAMPLTASEQAALAKLKADTAVAIRSTEQIRQLKLKGNIDEARRVLGDTFDPAAQGLLDAAGAFQRLQQQARDELSNELDSTARRALWTTVVLSLAAMALACTLLELLRRRLGRSLTEVVTFAQGVASGDLRGGLKSTRTDELGQLADAVSVLSRSLRDIVVRVRRGGTNLQQLSASLTDGRVALAQRTELAAAQLQETSAAMAQIAGASQRSAEAAGDGSRLASEAATRAVQGREAMQQVLSSMTNIGEASQSIEEIIAVIDSLAFQTNVLALNAAVEAARAGEEGRGFAVVAQEVRALAERSAAAARQVRDHIDASKNTVAQGDLQIARAHAEVERLAATIESVDQRNDEVRLLAETQRSDLGRVAGALQQLDTMSKANAAMAEETNALSRQLDQEARELAAWVSHFQLSSEGVENDQAHVDSAPTR